MASAHPLVNASVRGAVATVTLNRPEQRNALSTALIEALLAAFHAVASAEQARVVVLTHRGPVFCAGADLREVTAAGTREVTAAGTREVTAAGTREVTAAGTREVTAAEVPVARLGEVISAIQGCPKPVIARVGGAVRAGGVGLVAAADLAICADDATFACAEVRLGVVPAVISAPVRRLVGARAAAELFLTGEPIDGPRAARIGLVTASVPPTELDAAVDRYAQAILRGAPAALAATKALLGRAAPGGTASGGTASSGTASSGTASADEMAGLTALSAEFFGSIEGREGVRAYLERRDPDWITSVKAGTSDKSEGADLAMDT